MPDGPTLAFNVMSRRGAYVAEVATLANETAEVDVRTGAGVFVFCMDGTVTCGLGLRAFDLAHLGERTTVDASAGVAAVVTLTPDRLSSP